MGAGPLGRGSPEGRGLLSGGSPGGGEGDGLVLPPRAGDDPLIPGGVGLGAKSVDRGEDPAVALRGTGDAGRSEKKSDRLGLLRNHSGCFVERKLWVVRPQEGQGAHSPGLEALDGVVWW